MSLDDLSKNRSIGGRFRGRGMGRGMGRGRGGGGGTFRGRGVGMPPRGPLGVNNRPSSFAIAKSFSRAKDMIWRHDLFNDSMVASGLSGVETGTKLYISNLDYGVSNEDIKELFLEVGELKRWAVHYDRNGRPSGSAEVVFTRRSDAIAALKRYNNVQLDGKTMKIEVIGMNLGLPVTPRVNVVGGTNGRGKRTVVMTPEFGRGGGSSSNRSLGVDFSWTVFVSYLKLTSHLDDFFLGGLQKQVEPWWISTRPWAWAWAWQSLSTRPWSRPWPWREASCREVCRTAGQGVGQLSC